jgi:hypothetical protein
MVKNMLKVVRVCGTDRYGKEWVCGSADWYSGLVKVVTECGTIR